jgi:acyl dehydratase
VAAFARALGADPAAGVPPTYAAVYALGATAPQLFGDEEAAVDFANLLHAEQEFEWRRHPLVGETVTSRGRVATDVQRRGMRFITFETDVAAGDEPICRSRALFVIRGEQPPAAARASGEQGSRPVPPLIPQQGAKGAEITFTEEQIASYAEASGDRNPIHLDDAFARSVGLPGLIAHGMLQMGLLARVAGEAGQLRRLSCRFAGMVRPGDTVTFRGQEHDGKVQLSAFNQDGQPVVTKATAELLLPNDS